MKLKLFLTLMLSCVLYAITLMVVPHLFIFFALVISVVTTLALYLWVEADNAKVQRDIRDL